MFRNTFSKKVFIIIFFLLIILTPLLLNAELERGVKIESHTVIPDLTFIFQAETSSSINLYLAGSNGQIQQLTHTAFAQNASLSPDGNNVFFEDMAYSEIGEPYHIFKLDLNSKKITPISTDKSKLDCAPRCSPDGKYLAFSSRVADPNMDAPWRIYIMDINGKNRYPLDTEGDTNQSTPSWSPDSAKIVFVHSQLLPIKALPGLPLAFPIATPKIRDLKTKTTSSMLPAGLAVNDTTWSPLGDRIAFNAHDPINNTKTIWIVGVDGLHLERVTDGPDDEQPAWCPDETKLAFTRIKEGKKGVICLVDLKTRKVTELFSSSDASLEQPQVLCSKNLSAQNKGILN